MADNDLTRITLWLKAEEIAAPQALLVRDGNMQALVMSEYIAAAAKQGRA